MKYRTIIRCRGQDRKDIPKRIQDIVARNTKRGFQVNEYHTENEFRNIESDLVPYTLHKQEAGEHKPTSERKIRTLMDMTRSTVHSVPYRKISLLTIDSIVEQAQSILNVFPSKTVTLNTI